MRGPREEEVQNPRVLRSVSGLFYVCSQQGHIRQIRDLRLYCWIFGMRVSEEERSV